MSSQLPAATAAYNYMEGTIVRDSLRDILDRESQRVAALVDGWLANGLDHLYLVGCGGSLAIMEPVKLLLDRYSPIPVDRYSGWEFVHRTPTRLNRRAAVVLASHSGTTEEVLQGLALARRRGAATVSFSTPGTPLTTGADIALTYDSPATNLSKLFMAYLVATELIERTGDQAVGMELAEALQGLPERVHTAIQATEEQGRRLARQYRDAKGFYIVATGLLAGLAYQFATCNLLEMHWLHASVVNAAEFRHGPLEIVQPGLPMIFLLSQDEFRPVAERALAFAQRHGADTIVFDLAEISGIHPLLAPFGLHLPLQWLNWYLGVERDHPITTRRYMGKVPY